MAIFNPQPQDINTPQGLGYQGYRYVDKAGGGALNTLAAAIDTGAKGAVQAIDKGIEAQVNASVDKVQKLYGTDAATPGPNDLNTPPDLSKGISRLDTLSAGYQTGAITESHYYGQLNAIVKQLKSKYPGFEDRVDNWMQNKAGITPANALVSQLRQEAMAGLGRINAMAKDRLDYEEANTEPIVQKWGTAYFTDPKLKNMPMEELEAGVGEVKARFADIQHQTAAYALLESQNKASKMDAENFVRHVVGQYTNQYLDTGLGKDFQDQMKQLQALGHSPSAKDQAKMTQMFATLRSNVIAGITKSMSTDKTGSDAWFKIDQSTRDDVLKNATATIDAIADSALNKQWGWAAQEGNMGKAMIQQKVNDILGSDPVRAMAAAKVALGDAGASILIGHNLPQIEQALLGNAVSRAATGQGENGVAPSVKDTFDTISKAAESGMNVDSRTYKAIIDSNAKILQDPSIDSATKGRVVQYMFGSNDAKFLDMFNGDKQAQVYANMVNPQMTAAVAEIAKSNPLVWKNYSNWAYSSFLALNQKVAGDIKNLPPNALQDYSIRYNPSRGQIEAIYSKPHIPGMPEDKINSGPMMQGVNQAFQNMNTALSSIKSVVEQDGMKMDTVAKQMIQQLGIKVDTNDDDKRSGATNTLDSKDQRSELDTKGFLNFVSSAEGAGYNTMFGEAKDNPKYNLTNMTVNEVMDLQKQIGGSGAAGALQIQRSTLAYLKNKMGLKGDEFMTADLQHQMGDELLRRRGLEAFQTGKITKEQFANNLAQEWASLPTTSGKSFYEGDGINHAQVGLEDVMNNINQLASSANDNLKPNA